MVTTALSSSVAVAPESPPPPCGMLSGVQNDNDHHPLRVISEWGPADIMFYNNTPKWKRGSFEFTLEGSVSGHLRLGVVSSDGHAIECFEWRVLDDRNRLLPEIEQEVGIRFQFVGDHSDPRGCPSYPFFNGMNVRVHVRKASELERENFFIVCTVAGRRSEPLC